jgi:EmrB/QacA subfamily drug resistance transporter
MNERAALYQLSGRAKAIVVAGTLLGLLVAALNQTVVSTALPRIVAELGGLNMFSWVFTSYMLTATTVVLLAGKLSDIYGRKPFFMAGIAIFMIGSALSGASQDIIQLIVFRGLQGIGGGMMMGNAFAIVGDLFPASERGKYQGLFGATFGFASVIGPTLGGYLTDNLSWRAVFYLNVPVGVLALAVLWVGFPWQRVSAAGRRIDYAGALVLATAVVPLLLAMVWAGDLYPWASPQIITLLVVSAGMVVTFALVERYAVEPVMSITMFRNRIFVVCSAIAFLTGMGMFGAMAFMPLFMQGVLGDSATNSGVIMIPMMLGVVVASFISGQLVSRIGHYRLLIIGGGIGLVAGMFLMSQMGSNTAHSAAVMNMVIVGVGLGMSIPLQTLAVQNALSYRLLGIATSSIQFFRSIGGTIGIAVFGTMMTTRVSANLKPALPTDVREVVPDELLTQLEDPQVLLSPDSVDRLREGFNRLGADGPRLFSETLSSMRAVLGEALGDVFFVGLIVAAMALAVAFLLKELPLRTTVEDEDLTPEGALPPGSRLSTLEADPVDGHSLSEGGSPPDP